MDGSSPLTRRQQHHYRLLFRLEAAMEPFMFVLSFVWLWFFIVELIHGLSGAQQTAVTLVWATFVVEFLLKLWLAPHRLRYVVENWISVIALALPAFRSFRLLRALRVLRLSRVATTTRLVRALTSTRRAYAALKSAQGPAPAPEMNVALMVAVSTDTNLEGCRQLGRRISEDIQPEIESATGLKWRFHEVDQTGLDGNTPRRPADFLEDASLCMVEGPYDMVIVITDSGLVSRRRRLVPGVVSPVSRIALISTRQLTNTGRDQADYGLADEAVRWNAGALLLHLLGRTTGLKTRGHGNGHGESTAMAPFRFRPSRRSLPAYSASERDHLSRVGSRLPERELHGGSFLAVLIFHLLMAVRHPFNVIRPLIHNRALLLPLSLPGLATAAVAPSFLLVFTAEIWDVGLGMTNGVATLYAVVSILAASFYLSRAQSLFLPRKAKRIVTEHLAVANSVIFLSILLACIGLFLMVGILMLFIELYIFPADLVQTWPTLDQPEVGTGDILRLAAFISTVGVTTGALAGGFESRTVLQNLALFEDEGVGG